MVIYANALFSGGNGVIKCLCVHMLAWVYTGVRVYPQRQQNDSWNHTLKTSGTLYYLSYTLIQPGFKEIMTALLTASSSLEPMHITGMLNELIPDIWVSGENTQTARDTSHQHAIYKMATNPQK